MPHSKILALGVLYKEEEEEEATVTCLLNCNMDWMVN